MSGFILSCSFAEEVVKDKEHLTLTALSLVLMEPAANTQPWRMTNHRRNILAELISDTPSNEKEARMYETEDENDGYKALKLYLEKVNPKCRAFFQDPKPNVRPEDEVWFEARPLGVNTLANMMKKISEAAPLSKVDTNHSIRAIAITLWSNAGVPNRHILSISGHRNEQPLVHYNWRPSVAQLQNCSDVLSRAHSSKVQAFHKTPLYRQETSPLQAARETAVPLFKDCTIQNVQPQAYHPLFVWWAVRL